MMARVNRVARKARRFPSSGIGSAFAGVGSVSSASFSAARWSLASWSRSSMLKHRSFSSKRCTSSAFLLFAGHLQFGSKSRESL